MEPWQSQVLLPRRLAGVALDGGLTGVATRLVAGAATDTIGLVKLGYDAASFRVRLCEALSLEGTTIRDRE